MLETCENWLDLTNRCIYYARQTRDWAIFGQRTIENEKLWKV